MIILAIRTDKPEAELYLYDGQKKMIELKWHAHRELAETIHKQIAKILNKASISINDIEGIVCYSGPGSFTGLRIGLSVGNTMAYANGVPIIGTGGKEWLTLGIKELNAGKNDKIVVPFYGHPAKTTLPRK